MKETAEEITIKEKPNKKISFFKTRYRIMPDNYAGYEVQYRKWWLPFWFQHGFCNTHLSIERAKSYIDMLIDKGIEYP